MMSTETSPFTPDAEGWAQIAAPGAFGHAKGLNVFTREDLAHVAAAFTREVDPARGLLVDFEHESIQPEGSTEAAGWVTACTQRPDGTLWARVRWSDAGRAALEGGRYRFCSPVLHSEQRADGWHPVALQSLALTNRPNLKGLTPLSHRENQPTITMNKIALALGLAETADEAAILAAIEALKGSAASASADIANRELDAAGITDAATRAKILPGLLAHRESGLALLAEVKTARAAEAAAKAAAPAARLLAHKATPPGAAGGSHLAHLATLTGGARTAYYKAHQAAIWAEQTA